jgi:hypothetical protein
MRVGVSVSVSARARDARSTHFVRLVVRIQIHVLFRDVDRVDPAAERKRTAEVQQPVLVVAHVKSARFEIVAAHLRRVPSPRVANHFPFAIFIV